MSQQDSKDGQLPGEYSKVDRRYRESKYFLIDQLRHSDSVQEFRTIRHMITTSAQFSVGARTFQFAKVPIPVESDK